MQEAFKPHDIPPLAWHTLGHDVFFFQNKSYLCIIDYYSKFSIVSELHNQTTKELIHYSAEVIREYGKPKYIVSDAGSNILSSDFKKFCNNLEIKTTTTSSYNHAANGQVEWCIQTIKHIFKKCSMENHNFALALLSLHSCSLGPNLPPPAELLVRKMHGIVANINRKSEFFTGVDDYEIKHTLQKCWDTMKCNCDRKHNVQGCTPLFSGTPVMVQIK